MNTELINSAFNEHIDLAKETLNSIAVKIEESSEVIARSIESGGTIFWCGNGGSASDSQHLAGELIGRFEGDRRPLKSVSLTADSAVMTCIANDFGYEHIFSRQVEALGSEGDILVGITTSGNSQNVINAFKVAESKGMQTIGLLGKGGGMAKTLVHKSIIVSSKSTARTQEMHMLIGHILCDLIEEGLSLKK